MAGSRHVRIAIIGAGFGGVGIAARLKLHDEHDLIVFERARGIGGTWWVNRYPGCACEVFEIGKHLQLGNG